MFGDKQLGVLVWNGFGSAMVHVEAAAPRSTGRGGRSGNSASKGFRISPLSSVGSNSSQTATWIAHLREKCYSVDPPAAKHRLSLVRLEPLL